jgi:hypothetical protein
VYLLPLQKCNKEGSQAELKEHLSKGNRKSREIVGISSTLPFFKNKSTYFNGFLSFYLL